MTRRDIMIHFAGGGQKMLQKASHFQILPTTGSNLTVKLQLCCFSIYLTLSSFWSMFKKRKFVEGTSLFCNQNRASSTCIVWTINLLSIYEVSSWIRK